MGRMRETQAAIQSADHAWRALSTRDRHFDGSFVYAVRSTGLYCRPSCPARHPLRSNTLFFVTAEEAEHAGFSACSRCSPGRSAETLSESCVKAAIHFIESHPGQRVTLSTLSRRTGLSRNHVHETFKRIVGLTPKGYHDTRRMDGFKELLRRGESIAAASYASGFGSSRALYESAGKVMGMTPAVFQRGAGLRIRYAVFNRPLDLVLIAGTQKGICAVLQGGSRGDLIRGLQLEFPKADLVHESEPPDRWSAVVGACSREDPFVARFPKAIRERIYRAKVFLAQRSG